MIVVVLASTIPVVVISAAEAILPIKARIFRCVTNEERRQMCQEENVCCNLVDAAITGKMEAEVPDEQSAVDISRNENIEMHVIPYDGFISLATE